MNIASLADEAARRAIRDDLDDNLVVEAAAGTGKTTELIQRVIAILASGRATMTSLVAMTFTEKAAGEMKLRLRTELDRALGEPALSAQARARLLAATHGLETARIGTIHAFCADLLREHPLEAGVDPSFEVLDGTGTKRLIRRAFDAWYDATLPDPPEGVRRILRAENRGASERSPRRQLLEAAERLVETRDYGAHPRRDPLARGPLILELWRELGALAALAGRASSGSDPLARSLQRLNAALSRTRDGDIDAMEHTLDALGRDRDVWTSPSGRGERYAPGVARADVLAERERLAKKLSAANIALGADLAACLSRELEPVVKAYEAEKAQRGVVDFFDLLIFTRQLLRQHRTARQKLQARISHLFVDEFQDTDPVQTEIVLLLAADDPEESEPWRTRPVPGKVFAVGDPKQSIYRFRRADVSLYARAKGYLLSRGSRLLLLSTSFRSLPAIQALVNATFAEVMREDAQRGVTGYVPLTPFRAPRPTQPAVIALPVPAPLGKRGKVTKTQVKASFPDAVAAFIDWLVTQSDYVVREGERDVPIAARHVCLLFRRFRDFGEDATHRYVRALEARRIPHVLSGGRSFHAREEVVALSTALRAIEHPDDALAVYATLRGPFLSFADEALYAYKERFRTLHPLAPRPEVELPLSAGEQEVRAALELLARLHRRRNSRPISLTLAELLRETRAHAAIAIWPTGEQALGNVLRMLDFARRFEQRGRGTSFRSFVAWLAEQAERGETSDAVVVEESSDGVRVMTVHAAKGLEFPVVVLCDPTAPRRPERGTRYIDPERGLWAQALCGREPIELHEHRDAVRDEDEAEIIRLTYVAATRARELLVAPVVGEGTLEGWLDVLSAGLYPPPDRRQAPQGPGPNCPPFGPDSLISRPLEATFGEEQVVRPGEHAPERGEHRVVWWDPGVLKLAPPRLAGLRQAELLESDPSVDRAQSAFALHESWRERKALSLSRGAQPSLETSTVTARAGQPDVGKTAVLAVLDTGVDRSQRPSGPRFGTLVHQLLARGTSSGLSAMAALLARELGATTEEVQAAAAAAEAAFAHPLLAEARTREAHGQTFRELPLSVREADGTLLEGSIDLAFVRDEHEQRRLILVDFKTDLVLSELSAYERQLALYKEALEQTLALPVECVLLRV